MRRLLSFLAGLTLAASLSAAGNVDVVPPPIGDSESVSLDGAWKFRYVKGGDAGADEKFWQPGFDVSSWSRIQVPGHWELQGFAEPHYADDLQEGLGLYRRSFSVPADWRKEGRRVFLRFEGVLFGYSVWVNGQPVGEWNSGFNPATFDVTDALPADGGACEVAVRVMTHGRGWDFDTMDCWSISGIYREARLFSLPKTHLQEWALRTTLAGDGSARVSVDLQANAAGKVEGRVVDEDAGLVARFTTALGSDGKGHIDFTVARPKLWTAETPNLYTLTLDLDGGAQTVKSRVGLREVTTTGGVLKLNGKPIKLRGVDHHEIWPETGRVATEANLRRDLQLMRGANINFIRTSHYPPHPRLLELCDELGFYVDDEVPYIHGRTHLKENSYQPDLEARARATVLRDRNHASVLFWTTGNENPVSTNGAHVGEVVTALDPSRTYAFPTIGSQFEAYVKKFPATMGIYAPHYPSTKKASALAKSLDRPIVFTEYAHQRGLARAGSNVQDLWEIFQREERIAGGAVWHFQDQGLARTTSDAKSVVDGDLMAWIDDHRYYDTHGFFAMDGVVYSDRTPQLDYWMLRKVYSPIQVLDRKLQVEAGTQALAVRLENRRDFLSLEGVKLRWELLRNGDVASQGERALNTPARGAETLSLPVAIGDWPLTDVLTLRLTFTEASGAQPYERTLAVERPDLKSGLRLQGVLATAKKTKPTIDNDAQQVTVRTAAGSYTVNRATGQATFKGADGAVLSDGMGPNAGHAPTINDMGKGRDRLRQIWGYGLLRDAKEVAVNVVTEGETVLVSVHGTYARPRHPTQALKGGYTLRFQPDGSIQVGYEYEAVGAEGEATQLGFTFSVPAAQGEFRWLGQGPYAGYAGKDRQNEYGAFHLGRGDLHFPGNRRGVEFATLGAAHGAGLMLAGDGLTVDLEETAGGTLCTHLGSTPSDRTASEGKGDGAEVSSRVKMSARTRFSGSFTLLPLTGVWPQPLIDALGRPGEAAKPVNPFVRSYDR
jgi:beta-galactosidase